MSRLFEQCAVRDYSTCFGLIGSVRYSLPWGYSHQRSQIQSTLNRLRNQLTHKEYVLSPTRAFMRVWADATVATYSNLCVIKYTGMHTFQRSHCITVHVLCVYVWLIHIINYVLYSYVLVIKDTKLNIICSKIFLIYFNNIC